MYISSKTAKGTDRATYVIGLPDLRAPGPIWHWHDGMIVIFLKTELQITFCGWRGQREVLVFFLSKFARWAWFLTWVILATLLEVTELRSAVLHCEPGRVWISAI